MECASRSLAFHSYQTSQEIIYQEHLAKGLTDKYNVLSQQMDQLIHDANAQIKALQDKVQVAQQADCEALEAKNNELSSHFLEKAKALARQKKMYDSLKGQVMAANAAVAAGDEAKMTLQTVRAINRFADPVALAAVGNSEAALALDLLPATLNICKGEVWAVESTLVNLHLLARPDQAVFQS
ncbi:hypothetical protein N0V91_003029 [Didymella pomorum]|uniref:Uncharacterized protein n=1 Tax=Didymella pomorum TaxID=749634 RepID=A0A9W8ZHC7_9PLEO|nr:hypothetical protein N0V91_003029 [Didymella pomorum]